MSVILLKCEHHWKIATLIVEAPWHNFIPFHNGSTNMKQSLTKSLIHLESNDTLQKCGRIKTVDFEATLFLMVFQFHFH